jgi:hypothetical protein
MRAPALAAALVLMSGFTAGPQSAPGPGDEHAALPAGPGRGLMIRVCSKCHLPEPAADQQLDLAGWKTVVDLMASQGADATDLELEEIVQYLAKAFPASE